MDILGASSFVYVLIGSVLVAMLAKRLKMPYPPFALLFGIFLSKISVAGKPFFSIPGIWIKVVLILLVPLVVFDVFSRLKVLKLDTLGHHALNTSALLFIFSAFMVGIVAYALFDGITSIFISALLGIYLVASSDFDIPLRKHSRTIGKYLYEESLLSSAFMLLFVMSVVSLLSQGTVYEGFKHLFSGLGTGVFLGLIIFKFLKVRWTKKIGHYILLLSSVLCFLVAYVLDANPILAVAAFGYFFGNVTIHDRKQLHEFSGTLLTIVEMVVFMLFPFIVDIPLDSKVAFYSFVVFLMYHAARYFAVSYASVHDFTWKEKIFLTIYNPKGTVAIAGLIFISFLPLAEFIPLFPVIAYVIVYSVLISSVIAHFGHHFSRRL